MTADRSALVVVVGAIIHGPGWAISKARGAFQGVIRDVEDRNILIGADIVILAHDKPPFLTSAVKRDG